VDYRDFARYGGEIQSAIKTEKITQALVGIKGEELDWYRNNRHWLLNEWILNNTRATDNFIVRVMEKDDQFGRFPTLKEYQMQIFRTQWEIGDMLRMASRDAENETDIRKKIEHVDDILRSAVFGVGFNGLFFSADGMVPRRSMSGFVEQKGRLPTPHDRVEMVYLEGNGLKRWMETNRFRSHESGHEQFTLTSECCLIAK